VDQLGSRGFTKEMIEPVPNKPYKVIRPSDKESTVQHTLMYGSFKGLEIFCPTG